MEAIFHALFLYLRKRLAPRGCYTISMRHDKSLKGTLLIEGAALIRHLFWPSACVFCGALGELCCPSCLDDYMARFGGSTSRFGEPSFDLHYGAPYRGQAKDLVHRLKYRDEAVLGTLLGKALGRRFYSVLRGGTFVPLPLHEKSFRNYNQALLLARGMAVICEGSLWDCLFWKKKTEPQTGKNRAQRQRLSPESLGFAEIRENRNISSPLVLVDDVSTTGTTLKVAAEVLRKKGYTLSCGVVCCFTPPPGSFSVAEVR